MDEIAIVKGSFPNCAVNVRYLFLHQEKVL